MNDSTELLDKFTQILAYVGDDGAKDGYFLRENNAGNAVYSINIRPEPIEDVSRLVKKIKILLKKNTPVTGFPADVVAKTKELKDLYDSSANASKKELLDYISEFGNSAMQGGVRKTKRRSKRSKRTRTRARK